MNIIEPGTETESAYRKSGAWGSTLLNVARTNPKLAHWLHSGKTEFPDTPAMKFGRQFHAALDPKSKPPTIGPCSDKRTKLWKDAQAAVNIRDRILNPILGESQVSDVGRRIIASVKQADDSGKALVAMASEELNRTSPTGPTLREAARRFIQNRKEFKGNSGYTVDDYYRTLLSFEKMISNVHVETIEPRHIRKFRDCLMVVSARWCRGDVPDFTPAPEKDRLSSKTIVKQIKNLITFFNWCMREDLLQKNPAAMVDLPKVIPNPGKPPPMEFVDALCRMPWPEAPTIGIIEWEELPWFYRYTGARCGEIGQLRLQDVRTVDGVLVLDTVTLKATNRRDNTEIIKRRLVPVSDRLRPHLDRVVAERRNALPEDFLFPMAGHRDVKCITGRDYPRYAHGFSCLYNRHAKKITDMHLHCWRSYAISQMARAGIPPELRQRVVDHAIRNVHDGYTHYDLLSLKRAVDSIT